MTAGKKKPDDWDPETPGIERTLRDDAEKQFARSPKHSADLKGETPEELIHELRVHQIELEMQAEELRRAHIALEESRDKYLDLYEFAPVGYLTLNDKALITEVNLSGATLLGVDRKDLVNHGLGRFIAQKDSEPWDRYFMDVLKQGDKQICTLMLQRGDRSVFPARLESVRLTGSGDAATTVRMAISDISEVREAEEALKETNEYLNNLFDYANAPIIVWDPNFVITRFNHAFEDLTLISAQEIIGQGLDILFPKESRDASLLQIKKTLEGERWETVEIPILVKDGSVRTVLWNSASILDPDDRIISTIAQGVDITERKAAEKALQLTLSRLESAMGAGNIAWWEMDCITGNVTFSERKARMLGYPAEQFSHYTDFTTLLHPDDSEPAMQAMRDHLSGLKKQYEVEYRIRTRDGGYRWFRDIGRISEYAPDDKPLKVIGLVIDISEHKRVEKAQIKTTRKLNVLSGMIRKDLISQIFVLNGYLNLAKKHADDQDLVIKTLSKGDQALQSIHEIVEYTKDYEDMGKKPATWQNVNLALLFGLSHVSIGEIQHSLETENLEIFADPLLEKVCQRLFENSLAHGGHVTRIRVWHTTNPYGITILFEDDGIGIPQEKKEQIFLRGDDTTGFSMRSLIFVREILDITGITIRETGEPGKGARFEMAVPNGAWRSTGKGD